MHRHLRHSRHLTPPPPTTITTTTGGSPISQEIVYTEASPLYNSSMTTLSSSTVRSFPSSTSPSPNPRRASFLSAAPRISFSALPKSGFSPAISTTGFSRGFRCLRVRSMAATAGTEKKKAVEVFDTEDELAASLAEYTASLSEKFVRERGAFSVVLSGGSLVKSLRKLLAAPYVDAIDWSKWHVLWVDERVVPKDHDDSNYKLAYDSFLSKVPIQSGNVYVINDALSAKGAAEDYETCIKHLVKSGVVASSETTGFPKFDLMLMGMGPDGHIASLFPGHPLINESEKWVTFLNDSPKPPPERISFTLPVINSSSYIALVVAGSGKADAVHTALVNSNNSATLPVQMVSPEGELTWFLDRGAASKL